MNTIPAPKRRKHHTPRHRVRYVLRKTRPLWHFLQQFVQTPRSVGAICSSSKCLAEAMARMVPQQNQGLIIDLGAGTGCVTGALLRAGIAPQRIVAIEKSRQFGAIFRKRYPQVTLIVGDACQLNVLLHALAPAEPLCAIVSSLPFRVLPQVVVEKIQQQLHVALQERGGLLIQFTYALWMDFPLAKHGFIPHCKQFILKNIPPARVESYWHCPEPVG